MPATVSWYIGQVASKPTVDEPGCGQVGLDNVVGTQQEVSCSGVRIRVSCGNHDADY